jgi:DNA-binding response OmpR family regulator
LARRASILRVTMLPINVTWIDSDKNFVDTLVSQQKQGDSFLYLSDADEGSLHQTDWSAVDLVILDHQLKSMNGFELIERIRQKKENLPVLIVTDVANKDVCIKAINLGVNGFFEKPISPEGLGALINRFRPKGYDLKICHDRKAIFSQNKWVDLTSTEYKILETLKSARRRLTRSELQSAVWPSSSISENNLDTHLTNLKRKIPELNTCLNVKRGLGYFLDLKITV